MSNHDNKLENGGNKKRFYDKETMLAFKKRIEENSEQFESLKETDPEKYREIKSAKNKRMKERAKERAREKKLSLQKELDAKNPNIKYLELRFDTSNEFDDFFLKWIRNCNTEQLKTKLIVALTMVHTDLRKHPIGEANRVNQLWMNAVNFVKENDASPIERARESIPRKNARYVLEGEELNAKLSHCEEDPHKENPERREKRERKKQRYLELAMQILTEKLASEGKIAVSTSSEHEQG